MASSLVFSIQYPDGRREQLSVDADRALVGSGAHCEIRLPPEEAASEHLCIEMRQGGAFGESRARPFPLLNGMSFAHGRILPDSVVTVGQVQFCVAVVQMGEGAAAIRDRGEKTRTRKFLLLALLGATAVLAYQKYRQPNTTLSMPASLPDLFSGQGVGCAQRTSEPALALATELIVRANGKRERSPFAIQDGVAAVPLFRAAAACLVVAGQPADADSANRDAEALKTRMLDEYRLTSLRIERALVMQDWQGARKHIATMQSLLDGRSGDYVGWLSNVDRRITLKLAGEKKAGTP
jgi:hypothetical protein